MSLFLLIIYIISTRFVYKFYQRAFSKDGRWYGLNANLIDVFFTVTPIINTIVAICFLYEEYVKENRVTFNKFFKINK